MDTPAECEEWLQNKHPDVYDELKQRTQKLEDERTAQIAAMEAEKEEEAMAAAMEAEMAEGDDADEAAMLAAMEAEMAGEGEGGGEGEGEGGGAAAAGNTEGAKSADEGADEDDEGAKEKKKKRKTRRGGANNRRQTGKSAGPSVRGSVSVHDALHQTISLSSAEDCLVITRTCTACGWNRRGFVHGLSVLSCCCTHKLCCHHDSARLVLPLCLPMSLLVCWHP